ncbi:MAG: hypothetical protein DRP02_02360 [Candidatus Gerdarchaeota archaeon]|nr:MAG: hypothetical protein DRP02_02360 [Candidatus Gerdarchaeota archaeon]
MGDGTPKPEATQAPVKAIKPTGLKHVFFDSKTKINKLDVLKELKDGTFVCYDPATDEVTPYARSVFQYEKGGFWGTEKEAAASAVKRLTEYIAALEGEIEFFTKITQK